MFSVRHTDWYKRRVAGVASAVTKFEVTGFVAKHNTYCSIEVWYDNALASKILTGRVTENQATGALSINGINPHGDSILLDVKNS